MRVFLAALLLVIAGSQAVAGAWPRGKGNTFLSVSHAMSTGTQTILTPLLDLRSYTSLFAEYGLTDKFTVGLDAGRGGNNGTYANSAIVFGRYPVWASDSGHRLAVDFGIGSISDPVDGSQTRLRPGIAWGYGFDTRWGGGWLGIESSLEYRKPSGDTAFKGDITAGYKPTDNWMLILQVQTGHYPGSEPLVRIAPSVVRRLSEKFHLQFGGFAGVQGDDSIGGKAAIWASF